MKALVSGRALAEMARRVFRTNLAQPGFSHLDLGPDGTPEAFQEWRASQRGGG